MRSFAALLVLLCCVVARSAAPLPAPEGTWDPREKSLKSLVSEVGVSLRRQDPDTGRFGSEPWICDDQNVIFPLAVAWSIQDAENPFYHDPALLEAIIKGGDALVEAQDEKGLWTFRKKDNSTWGQTAQPWTYSRWIRAFQLIKETMPPNRRQHWEKGLKLGFERIGGSLKNGQPHNKTCHLAMALYCAGRCLDRADWRETARAFMARVVAAQSPGGYWSEHSGPVVGYNFVYVDSLGAYYAMSHDDAVLPALRRAAVFHTLFTYPDGSQVETIDERNPFHPGIGTGNVGFSFSPEGRAYLARQMALRNWDMPADTAASFLLHGETGAVAPPSSGADRQLSVFGKGDALVFRKQPWFICLSAFVSDLAENRWIQDRQNFVSVYHHGAGLILGGGNTKLQPYWSTFTLGNPSQLRHRPGDENPDFKPKGGLIHIPSRARIDITHSSPALNLQYGDEECRVSIQPVDDNRLTVRYEATCKSGQPVEGHLPFLVPRKAVLKTAIGKSIALGEKSQTWSASALGAWFEFDHVRVSVPRGARLVWPARRHNPYKKDGSSTLADARLVLCLPFSNSVSHREITLEVTSP